MFAFITIHIRYTRAIMSNQFETAKLLNTVTEVAPAVAAGTGNSLHVTETEIEMFHITNPFYYAFSMAIFFFVVGIMGGGQSHGSWAITAGAWAFIILIGQLIATFSCAYYWRKLHDVPFELQPRWQGAIMKGTIMVMIALILLSIDVFHLLAYSPTYSTLTSTSNAAQRVYDSFFTIISACTFTIFPSLTYFTAQQYSDVKSIMCFRTGAHIARKQHEV